MEHALQPLLEEVALERRRELAMVKEHVRISLDTLIDRQTNQLMELAGRHDRGDDVGLATQNAQQRLEDLNHRYERRMTELASESEIAIADVHHMASALVLPHPEGDRYGAMVSDPEIERIAMEEAMRHESARGWSPQDVSSENRGFDILSQNAATGGVRFIEVKGRAGRGEVSLSRHEFITAGRLH